MGEDHGAAPEGGLRSDFDYALPEELIAQEPAERRDSSRLLVLGRRDGRVDHRQFDALPGLLREGDLLVVNDTRVVPARLVGRKESGGRVEALFLGPEAAAGPDVWRCLVRGARLRVGTSLHFPELEATVHGEGERPFVLLSVAAGTDVTAVLERHGAMPLPPYIRRSEPRSKDRERYQTVYASRPGAVAAPTAGLHFTGELLARLEASGIGLARITLEVGYGTFQPVRADRLDDHVMHSERYEVSPAAAEAVAETRQRRGRVVAVGTSVVRSLEASAVDGQVRPGGGWCDLFIHPGYRFGAIDAMITNFHLPESTPLMLVAALAGRQAVLAAYDEAIERRYRFFSYGDAMLVI